MARFRQAYEAFKTVLLAALFISALFFTYKTWVFNDAMLEDPSLKWLKNTAVLFGFYNEPLKSLPSIIDIELSEASRPIVSVITTGKGRFGAMYGFSETDAIYDRARAVMGEALSSSEFPEHVGENMWREALLREGIYFEFPDAVPLNALCQWLGGEAPSYLNAYTKRIIIKKGEKELAELYYIDRANGDYYKCRSKASLKSFENDFSDISQNDSKYVFESDTDYHSLNKYTLLKNENINPFLVGASFPEKTEVRTSVILRNLGFNPNTIYKYPESDGTEVFVDNSRTVRITGDGEVIYKGSSEWDERAARLEVKKRGNTPTIPELIEAARAVSVESISPYCGEARVYLSEVTAKDNKTVIMFDYSINGARVFLDGGRHAAQVTIEGDIITEVRLAMRTYANMSENTGVLPEFQASAILSEQAGSDFYLALGYFDNGMNTIKAQWYADN